MSLDTTADTAHAGRDPVFHLEMQLRDPGAASRIVEEAGIDGLPDLLQAATQLGDARSGLEVLEAAWRRQPMALPVLAAFLQIGRAVPVDDMVAWSGRLRVRGWSSLCPLLAVARDTAADRELRLQAASAAWQTFFDPTARQVIVQLGGNHPEGVPAYFTHSRPEVVDRVPVGARRILDLGCAAGRLGASIKYRQPAAVTGVELDPEAARVAAEVLDTVLAGSISEGLLDRLEGGFDAIVAADILEHLPDPWSTVRSLGRLLRPGGTLVVSVPNVANLGVLTALVAGRFDYQPEGILDRTHLRFFTRATAVDLLADAGLAVESVSAIRDPGLPVIEMPSAQTSIDVVAGPLVVKGVDSARLEDLTTMQFLLTARRREALVDEQEPEVWDCVAFDGDMDFLGTRLGELARAIHHLVLVDVQGAGEECASPPWQELFGNHDVQIHHVVVQVPPDITADQRESTQRDAALQVVSAAQPQDLVLLSDATEIVTAAAVDRILDATSSGPVHLEIVGYTGSGPDREVTRQHQAVALRARDLPKSLSELRHGFPAIPVVEDSGWHRTYADARQEDEGVSAAAEGAAPD